MHDHRLCLETVSQPVAAAMSFHHFLPGWRHQISVPEKVCTARRNFEVPSLHDILRDLDMRYRFVIYPARLRRATSQSWGRAIVLPNTSEDNSNLNRRSGRRTVASKRTGPMKIKNSLKSLKGRHRANRLVRRKGRVYIINKTNPRYKARQG